MGRAICSRCGESKGHPAKKCGKCEFLPNSEEDIAKSMLLCDRFEMNGEFRGKSRVELLEIGRAIREGTFRFDPKEVHEVVMYIREIESIPTRTLTWQYFRAFILPFLIAVGVALLVTRLR